MATNTLMNLTPTKFEMYVHELLKREKLAVLSLKTVHLEHIEGMDGEYEIDVVATISLFGGADVRFLIECKRYSSSIKRDVVMLLNQKLQSTGSQKGMIFSTSDFQSGAIEFAKHHGIALIFVECGQKHVFVANEKGSARMLTEGDLLIEAHTASLQTNLTNPLRLYLARQDVYPGENLKSYLEKKVRKQGAS